MAREPLTITIKGTFAPGAALEVLRRTMVLAADGIKRRIRESAMTLYGQPLDFDNANSMIVAAYYLGKREGMDWPDVKKEDGK